MRKDNRSQSLSVLASMSTSRSMVSTLVLASIAVLLLFCGCSSLRHPSAKPTVKPKLLGCSDLMCMYESPDGVVYFAQVKQ